MSYEPPESRTPVLDEIRGVSAKVDALRQDVSDLNLGLAQRVTALETRQDNTTDDVIELKGDVKKQSLRSAWISGVIAAIGFVIEVFRWR